MPEAILPHLFCMLMFISRGLDMLSTWLVTPKMTLEANPAMRKVKWPSIFLINLPLLTLPYFHPGFSLTMIVLSFLVAGNTLTNASLTRGLGERNHLASIKKAIRGNSLSKAVGVNTLGALSVMAAGILLMLLSKNPWVDLIWWGALGVVCYGLTALLHINLNLIRLFRKSKNQQWRADTSVECSDQRNVKLELSTSQYEQIHAKAQLFGKSVDDYCRMVVMESKARLK
ncbi:MAG: hypothetical protein HQM14_07695 [SAR324 cluster bacterium]|nr:hypothetical protein [SAR324 cluster bacterium]